MPSLLVLRPGAIGDTLLTIPALAALGTRFPHTPIHLVGNPQAAPLAVLAGAAARWTAWDSAVVSGLFTASGPGPAGALAPLADAIAWCTDPEGVLHANLTRLGAGRVVLAASRPPDARRHVSDYLVDSLAPLGVDDRHRPRTAARLAIPPRRVEAAADYLRELGLAERRWLAVHPGSGSPAKNWPATALASLVERLPGALGLVPGVLAGPADDAALDALLKALPMAPVVLRNVPLVELAALLPSAAGYVGNDSGPTHLAAMLDLPTLALFGPTDPSVWAPRGRRVRVLHAKPLADLEPGVVLDALADLV